MKTLTEPLLEEMENTLQQIRQHHPVPLCMALEAVSFLYTILERLKQMMLAYQFADEAEEIYFFKHMKPRFLSQLHLYNKVLEIETQRPVGCLELARDFVVKEMLAVERFFTSHREFYHYYRTSGNHFDEQYFTRRAFDIRLVAGRSFVDTDHRFSTTHDALLAMCMANEMLLVHLNQALAAIDRPEAVNTAANPAPLPPLQWTDSKASLVELIYALHTHAVIDNGRPEIKDIAAYFEQIFNIDLGNYYHTYLELRTRKMGRTKFLDTMREKLQQRMDEQEERG